MPVSRLRDDPDGEPNRWQSIVDLGWLGISVPEEAGGIGLSALEEVLAAQDFGRQLISTNYPATVIAAHAFHKAGDSDTVGALLAGKPARPLHCMAMHRASAGRSTRRGRPTSSR